MKALFTLLFLLVLTHYLNAQDLIITTEGESLECKINKVDEDHIFFTYEYMGETRTSSIPRAMVKDFKTNFRQQKNHHLNSFTSVNKTFPKLIFALNTGLSYRTGKVPENLPKELRDYVRSIKSGYHMGGHLGCLVNEKWGFGLKYNRFRSSASRENMQLPLTNGSSTNGKIEDDITISYVGPAFSSSFMLEPNHSLLLAHFSLGLLQYHNKAILIDPYTIRGNNVGFTIDLGYDVPVSRNFAWGVQLSYVSGFLTQLEIEKDTIRETVYLQEESYVNLSRIDLSIGIRF